MARNNPVGYQVSKILIRFCVHTPVLKVSWDYTCFFFEYKGFRALSFPQGDLP